MLYYLDLLGTLAFAITGAFKAKRANLTFFGVVFLGVITAIGGGTIRDIIISRTPLFYLSDMNYLLVAVGGGIVTFFVPVFLRKGFSFFRFIDSIGLATFSIIGVSVAYNYIFLNTPVSLISFMVCVFLGMVTAFTGGVIRDSVMGDIPMALRSGSNYALSSFLGASLFYLLMFYNTNLGIIISLAIVLYMREIISKYGIFKRYLNTAIIKQ